LSDFHTAFKKKRHSSPLLQVVARMKWNERNAWQWAEYCSLDTFLSVTSLQTFFCFLQSNHTHRQKIFYNVRYLKKL